MNAIHKNGYDVAKAIACFIPEEGPILCRDEMEEWSSGKFQVIIKSSFYYMVSLNNCAPFVWLLWRSCRFKYLSLDTVA